MASVSIVATIAIAFLIGGLVGVSIKYEKLLIKSFVQGVGEGGGNWTITLNVNNAGTADTTIDDITINGISFSSLKEEYAHFRYDEGTWRKAGEGISILIPSGSSVSIVIQFEDRAFARNTPSPRTTVEVKLHTLSGRSYPQAVVLP